MRSPGLRSTGSRSPLLWSLALLSGKTVAAGAVSVAAETGENSVMVNDDASPLFPGQPAGPCSAQQAQQQRASPCRVTVPAEKEPESSKINGLTDGPLRLYGDLMVMAI